MFCLYFHYSFGKTNAKLILLSERERKKKTAKLNIVVAGLNNLFE